ncbi:MAG: hypothetical protein KAT46_04505 [Deltaproteobacteria bacterium]|nr:hypothetical protein [Deltaproteobacteria bacterium]
MSNYPSGIIFTEDNPGKWEGKATGHLPSVTVDGGKVTVKTDHVMTKAHFIVRHTIVSADGVMVGDKTFSPDDADAVSEFELPSDTSGKLYVTSFCNQHDLWLVEVEL